jgi:hypothetical protein
MNHQNQTPNKWHMRPCSLQTVVPHDGVSAVGCTSWRHLRSSWPCLRGHWRWRLGTRHQRLRLLGFTEAAVDLATTSFVFSTSRPPTPPSAEPGVPIFRGRCGQCGDDELLPLLVTGDGDAGGGSSWLNPCSPCSPGTRAATSYSPKVPLADSRGPQK